MAPDGTVFDYFGGAADLAAGLVRFVGDAETRITEDYLRILRFFRFYARYGKGAPDRQAIVAITAHAAGLAGLSAERVWSELSKILAAPNPGPAVALMAATGVLTIVLPEGSDAKVLSRLLASGAPANPLLRFAALALGDVDALAARLRLSSAERDRLAALRAGKVPAPDDDDDHLRRLLADNELEILLGRVWLRGTPDAGLLARLSAMPRPVFPLAGRDGLALGAKPGPALGQALRQARLWWLQNGCRPNAAQCKQQLARLLRA
jgi:poly(A) polymerase/tRNA nucleotidyltransferase (CCA-adding enzyme)